VTISLVGRCPETGMLGVAVMSSSPAVGARCAHVRSGAGAAASQNLTDPRLGTCLLELMASGVPASAAVETIVRSEANSDYRQLAAVDSAGGTASYSGRRTLGTHGSVEGEGAVAAGNLLAHAGVLDAVLQAFVASREGHLGERLIQGLVVGRAAGGEEGPVRSAGLLVADRVAWPIADLRVDWHENPTRELERLWLLWKPQLDDYVMRAVDPARAPSFGVPGAEDVAPNP
jgi:uncharacterized Ntn-hydrolase superfamily protein